MRSKGWLKAVTVPISAVTYAADMITEQDTTQIGTIELTDGQWRQFCDLVSGGTVKAREESADSGDSGPWLYLYWTNDKSKYQKFSFASYGDEKAFEEFCLSLAPKDETSKADENANATDEDVIAISKRLMTQNKEV